MGDLELGGCSLEAYNVELISFDGVFWGGGAALFGFISRFWLLCSRRREDWYFSWSI